jgi:hypothetical protein
MNTIQIAFNEKELVTGLNAVSKRTGNVSMQTPSQVFLGLLFLGQVCCEISIKLICASSSCFLKRAKRSVDPRGWKPKACE